jgi:hypothetical protein
MIFVRAYFGLSISVVGLLAATAVANAAGPTASCLNEVGKGLERVAKMQGKEAARCVKNAGRGRLAPGESLQSCLGADSRSKVARQEVRLDSAISRRCSDRPPFGLTSAFWTASAARHGAIGTTLDLFGKDPNAAVRLDSIGAKCQRNITRDMAKLHDAMLAAVGFCRKAGVSAGTITSREELSSCLFEVDTDTRGRVARAQARLDKQLAGSCSGLDTSAVFPGACTAATDTGTCLAERTRCQVCKTIVDGHEVQAECDIFDDGLANLSCDVEVPQVFVNLRALPPTGREFHVAKSDPCASDGNDGLAATCTAGGVGPWKTLAPLISAGIGAGDSVKFHTGTYTLGQSTAAIVMSGTPTEPVRFAAAAGEAVVFDGGWPAPPVPGGVTPVLRMAAAYTIIAGLEITGCDMICVQMKEGAEHSIFADMRVEGGGEDGIKATHARGILIAESEFTAFHNEAIDVWGSQHFWIVDSDFHDNDTSWREPSSAVWAKGGSLDVHLTGNTFRNLEVGAHGLLLGGCCWTNWAAEGGLLLENGSWVAQPVARQVRASNNSFDAITLDYDEVSAWAGAIGVQGCVDCSIIGNEVRESEAAIGIHATSDRDAPCFASADCTTNPADCTCSYSLYPQRLVVEENRVVGAVPSSWNSSTARLYNFFNYPGSAAQELSIAIDNNTYCVDEPATVRVGGTSGMILDAADWQALGFDLNSTLSDEASCSSPGGTAEILRDHYDVPHMYAD